MNQKENHVLKKITLKIPANLLNDYENLYDLVEHDKKVIRDREFFEDRQPSASNKALLNLIITECNNHLFPNDLFFINDKLRILNNLKCNNLYKNRNYNMKQNVFSRINVLKTINIFDKILNRKIKVEIVLKVYCIPTINTTRTQCFPFPTTKLVLIDGYKK